MTNDAPTKRREYDVVVVGAGIGGSAAAIQFGRAGLRVALVERSPDPAHFKRACTHSIQASAIPILEDLGVADELRAAQAPQQYHLNLYTPDGWLRFRLSEEYRHPRLAHNVRRETLDPLVRRRAGATEGVDLLQGWKVEDVTRNGRRVAGVVARNRDGERLQLAAQLVVGADGRASPTAQAAGIRERRIRNERFAFWGYFANVEVPMYPDNQIYLLDPTWCYVMPTDSGLTLLGIVGPKTLLPEMRRDPKAFHRRFHSSLPDGPDYDRAEQIGNFVSRLDMTNIWRRSAGRGIALVGDAAVAVDPVWGWGCGWALQSSRLLVEETAPALRRRRGLDPALVRYAARHAKTFGGHYLHALDYSSARKFNPIERMMFGAAIRDQPTADHVHAYAVSSIGLGRFIAPGPMLRAARVYLSNRAVGALGSPVPEPEPSLAARELVETA